MRGNEVVEVIVDEWRLINAVENYGGESSCQDQTRDGQDFAKEGLLAHGNSPRHVPSRLSLMVLPRVHVLPEP